jgi:hypothetical protein
MKRMVDEALRGMDGDFRRACSRNGRPSVAREGDEGGGDDEGDRASPQGGARRRSRNKPVDFRGERRVNDMHRSATDPEARLYRKSSGKGAFLSHSMDALPENRHGLVLAVDVAEANGLSERERALGSGTSANGRASDDAM